MPSDGRWRSFREAAHWASIEDGPARRGLQPPDRESLKQLMPPAPDQIPVASCVAQRGPAAPTHPRPTHRAGAPARRRGNGTPDTVRAVSITLGIFDLFAYAVPGSLYLGLFTYVAIRVGWVDQTW